MIVYDAHAHAGSAEEIALRAQNGILTVLSCGNVQQAAQAEALLEHFDCLRMTAGVHPWYAQTQALDAMLPYMQRASFVGEIGLDSVWCNVPMSAQRSVFSAQFDWAAANGRGVVLHTKGCEMEIARAVEGFPFPVVVHWYSGKQDALERFASQGCYFTIGPDVPHNPSTQAVARIAADNRLLFETDGMDAVRWALSDHQPLHALPDVLLSSAQITARLRGQSPDTVIQNANGNFCRLFSR